MRSNWKWSLEAVNVPLDVPEWGDLRVGHVDTGIYKGPTFGSWVHWNDGLNLVETDTPNQPWPLPPTQYPPAGPLDLPIPQHGTRTASVLCGADPSGFRGVAPRLPIVPVRANNNVVLDDTAEQSRVGQGILHVLDKKCSVISISFGMPKIHKGGLLGAAVDEAYEKGVIVCGAGGQVFGATCYPGKFFRAICVGGYKFGDGKHWPVYYPYNGTGSFVDVWAPADPITRANGEGEDENGPGSLDKRYGQGDGTSYATPHVAAAAAYWLTLRGAEIDDKYSDAAWKRVEAFRLLLKTTARDLSGNWGLEGTRLPMRGEVIPTKGNDSYDRLWISGGLDIQALLKAPLPDIPDSLKARPAIGQNE